MIKPAGNRVTEVLLRVRSQEIGERDPSGYYRTLSVLTLGGFTLFHLWYIASGYLDLAPDEAHYWEWSRRLDWSYYSKGPMVAYLIAAATRLGGHTAFFVRLPAVLLALATGTIIYLLAYRLFHSDRAAFLSILILGFIPLYAAGSILMTIDAPLVFFWALGVLCFWEATQRQDSQGNDSSLGWWVILGGALGLGLLSKYTMALFFPCAFLYLWFSRRSQLRIAGFCLSTLIAIVLFAPVLLWNFNNEWVSLRHVMGQTGLSNASPGFSAKSFFEFLGSQLGAISPLLFPATIVGVIRGCYLRDRVCRDRFLVLAMFSGPVLSFFFLWSVYHKVQGNWAAVAYVTAVIALAAWWDESMDKKAATRGGRVMSMFPLLLLPGVFTVVIAHFPAVLNQIGIDLPPRLDLTRRLQGWQELGLATGALLQSRGHSGPFLMSDTYQIASELAFYVPGQPRVYNVNLGRRMNQYDIWGGLDALKDKDGFFVTRGDVDVPTALVQMCRTVRKVKVVTSYHRGHKAQVFSIFECDGYRGAVNQSPVLY